MGEARQCVVLRYKSLLSPDLVEQMLRLAITHDYFAPAAMRPLPLPDCAGYRYLHETAVRKK